MYKLLLITLALLSQACAFTDATLPVQHDNNANIIGPVSDIGKITFTSPQLDDTRTDKQRIGWKKNSYGQQTASIYTEQPVHKILENAITDAINDNGHTISEDGPIIITGSVDRFWFETDINFWTIEFTGDIQCTLNFIDSITSETIYTSAYTGTHKKETGGGLEKTWTEVMGHAVDNLIEEIVFDEELSDALQAYRDNGAPTAPSNAEQTSSKESTQASLQDPS